MVIKIDPRCASGTYSLMSYACGSLILGSIGLSTLSKTKIHGVFPLIESHCFMAARIRSASFSSKAVLNSAEDGYSLYKRLAMPPSFALAYLRSCR